MPKQKKQSRLITLEVCKWLSVASVLILIFMLIWDIFPYVFYSASPLFNEMTYNVVYKASGVLIGIAVLLIAIFLIRKSRQN